MDDDSMSQDSQANLNEERIASNRKDKDTGNDMWEKDDASSASDSDQAKDE